MLETFTTPRHYLLHRASTPGRPLIIFLGGWTQRIAPPGETRWHDWLPWQWRKNAVTESGLLDLAERHDVSVCWIASAQRAWAPWWRSDWNVRDISDIDTICGELWYRCRPSKTFAWGFSDGATLCHLLATDSRASHVFHAAVAHSGLWPSSLKFWKHCPVLLACGADEPHASISDAQPAIQQRYLDAGRACELWELPGVRHEWSRRNEAFLQWCLKASE